MAVAMIDNPGTGRRTARASAGAKHIYDSGVDQDRQRRYFPRGRHGEVDALRITSGLGGALILCRERSWAAAPPSASSQPKADSLDRLASDFWTWRAEYRPFTFDDVPRMEHASGLRDWSAASIAKQRGDLAEFERRWKALRSNGWPVRQMVDYRLIGSALARVRWELDVNPRWQRDPAFYVEQTVGALQEELMPPAPFSDAAREKSWRERKTFPRSSSKPSSI